LWNRSSFQIKVLKQLTAQNTLTICCPRWIWNNIQFSITKCSSKQQPRIPWQLAVLGILACSCPKHHSKHCILCSILYVSLYSIKIILCIVFELALKLVVDGPTDRRTLSHIDYIAAIAAKNMFPIHSCSKHKLHDRHQ
jgi:hypothetical protein